MTRRVRSRISMNAADQPSPGTRREIPIISGFIMNKQQMTFSATKRFRSIDIRRSRRLALSSDCGLCCQYSRTWRSNRKFGAGTERSRQVQSESSSHHAGWNCRIGCAAGWCGICLHSRKRITNEQVRRTGAQLQCCK
jgi:hypothetical protein